jgi:hypothetical protein
MSVTEAQIIGGGEFEFGFEPEKMNNLIESRVSIESILNQPRACGCPRNSSGCPDPAELVSGSIFENMPCNVLLGKLALQEKRITGNADASFGLLI